MVCMIAQAWKPYNNSYHQINTRLPQVQSASSPQIPGAFHTTFEPLIVFITTILALNCLIIRTEGVFLITLKLLTLQQLLLIFCGTTKINELCLELQNSLMLNQQVGKECSLVLSDSILTENVCPPTYAGFLLIFTT